MHGLSQIAEETSTDVVAIVHLTKAHEEQSRPVITAPPISATNAVASPVSD